MEGIITLPSSAALAYPTAPTPATRARLSIFGLGYVGAVSAACFADIGCDVIGVDTSDAKVALMAAGRAPIVEPQLPELLSAGVDAGRISATRDAAAAVAETDISLVCVGTPSAADGSCDLTYLRSVCENIGQAIANKPTWHLVVIRSTVPPGTTESALLPVLEQASGKRAGRDFGLAFHPEFLREATAVADFFSPPKTVVGGIDARSCRTLAALYDGVDDAVIETDIAVAETVKYVDNTWHAVKVSFANEIGKVCQASGIDSHAVMDVFVQDTKLNISAYYMRPGYAFGGSCLPKDVRGITDLARKQGVRTPLLNSILPSNRAQIAHAIEMVERLGCTRIAVLGLTFKAGTDDLRESPVLPLVSHLRDRGCEVTIHDPQLDVGNSVRHHLMHAKASSDGTTELMQHLPELMGDDLQTVVDGAELLLVSHNTPAYRDAVANRRADQHAVDLVRLSPTAETSPTYHGICW